MGWWCISDSATGGLWSPAGSVTGSIAKTTSFAVGAGNDNGKRFSNFGATGTVVATLPAGATGLRFAFRRIAGFALQIDPDGTEVIRGGGAGKYLQLGSDGAAVIIEWDKDSLVWEIVEQVGTITYEA
jgi:hypothetical protein